MHEEFTQEPILLREIKPLNILSFGPETNSIPLRDLNVLIGPNGSGKSNLIECVALMRATTSDVRNVFRDQGGGVNEWIWKGANRQTASIELVVEHPRGQLPLRHVFSFGIENQSFHLEDERIENEHPYLGEREPYFFYRYQRGYPVLNVNGNRRELKRESVNPDESILVQRRDPDTYPEISYLADVYGKIRIYREWAFGRNTVFRAPQDATLRNDRLEENFSNLGLFLNRLRRIPKAKTAILRGLRDLYEGLDDFDVSIEGGTVQVFFTEGDFTIPATRLSDGTVRYLCLLAILCDPTPPPLICIEEPELGLHPDILPNLADLLKKASERTQLIITTHSDLLVDALTDFPESVLTCEKQNGTSVIKRLESDSLKVWLENYRLGELWTRGELGGTRW